MVSGTSSERKQRKRCLLGELVLKDELSGVDWLTRIGLTTHLMAYTTNAEYTTVALQTAPSREHKRIPELDGVRGLAILMVMLFHYIRLNSQTPKWLFQAFIPSRLMWSGVDLFFVLSGLLIGGILLDHRESPSYYSVFYARRIHRIFPLYYLMVAILVVGVWVVPSFPLFAGASRLWTYPFFAQNLRGHFTNLPPWIGWSWSLAVEEQFYLILPFVIRYASRRVVLYVMAGCIVFTPLLRAVMVMNGAGFEQVYSLLVCRADALAYGVLAAIIIRNERAKTLVRANATALYVALIGLSATLPMFMKWSRYVDTIGFSVLDSIYFLLIVLLLVQPIWILTSVFNNSLLRWLGTVSFCIYITHTVILQGLLTISGLGLHADLTSWAMLRLTVEAVAITLVIAQLSWLFLEKPLMNRAREKFVYKPAEV